MRACTDWLQLLAVVELEVWRVANVGRRVIPAIGQRIADVDFLPVNITAEDIGILLT